MKMLIYNVTAVTMESYDRVIEDAYILLEGNRISYVGTKRPDGVFDKEIDAKGMVAMPGLINAHTHTAMTVLRSYADDMNLQDWLFNKIFPFEDTLTPQMVYDASQRGIMEMLSTGTTCFNDMYFFQEETAKAARELGIRGVLCEGITDGNLEAKLVKIKEQANDLKEDDVLRFGVSPHAVYTCGENTLKCCAEEAKKRGVLIHTHLSETQVENADSQRDFGMSPSAWMEKNGLFDVPAVAAHGVWLTDEDMDILKKHNVTVVHNPVSNLKLASGIAEIPKLIEKGINIALGTDGASSNNNLDLFEEIKLTGILHKGITGDPTVVPAFEVLKMATINGAKALGYNDLGLLKEGYLADLILIDFSAPYMTPNHNTISNLVYATRGSDVVYTIVNGEIVYNRGEITPLYSKNLKEAESFLA